MVKSKAKYDVEVVCRNCGNVGIVEGDFGHLLTDSTISMNECEVCGCTGVLLRAFGDGEFIEDNADEDSEYSVKRPSDIPRPRL